MIIETQHNLYLFGIADYDLHHKEHVRWGIERRLLYEDFSYIWLIFAREP